MRTSAAKSPRPSLIIPENGGEKNSLKPSRSDHNEVEKRDKKRRRETVDDGQDDRGSPDTWAKKATITEENGSLSSGTAISAFMSEVPRPKVDEPQVPAAESYSLVEQQKLYEKQMADDKAEIYILVQQQKLDKKQKAEDKAEIDRLMRQQRQCNGWTEEDKKEIASLRARLEEHELIAAGQNGTIEALEEIEAGHDGVVAEKNEIIFSMRTREPEYLKFIIERDEEIYKLEEQHRSEIEEVRARDEHIREEMTILNQELANYQKCHEGLVEEAKREQGELENTIASYRTELDSLYQRYKDAYMEFKKIESDLTLATGTMRPTTGSGCGG